MTGESECAFYNKSFQSQPSALRTLSKGSQQHVDLSGLNALYRSQIHVSEFSQRLLAFLAAYAQSADVGANLDQQL
jgi:uncharacterized membrane-anchored protein